ncbi:MAG: hypothetical protein ACLTDV_04280 [Eubacterium sp.]
METMTWYLSKIPGEMILGKDRFNTLKRGKAICVITSHQNRFDVGEVRPEYYYDCKMKTPDMQKAVQYTKEDQPINFEISSGIMLAANTQASDVCQSY